MKCKDCKHFNVRQEPLKNGRITWDFGMAECKKYNLIIEFRTHAKLNSLECVEDDAITFAQVMCDEKSNTKDVFDEAIECFGIENQSVVAIEEMTELQKEITKALRGRDNKAEMTEEIADVYIMLTQIERMYGIDYSEVMEVMKYKRERLKTLINKKRLESDAE